MSAIFTGLQTGVRLLPTDLSSDSFTIMTCDKPSSVVPGFAPLIAIANSDGTIQSFLAAEAGVVCGYDGWGANKTAQVATLSTGTWFKSALRGYRDGGGSALIRATVGTTHSDAPAASVFSIGRIMLGHNYVGAQPGGKSHVRIWNASLTDAEVAAEFASETPVKTEGLIAEFDLGSSLLARVSNRDYAQQLLPFVQTGVPDSITFDSDEPTFEGGEAPAPEPDPTQAFSVTTPDLPPGDWRIEVTSADGTATAISDYVTFLGLAGTTVISSQNPQGVTSLQLVPVAPASALSVVSGADITVQLQDSDGNVVDGSLTSADTAKATVTRTLAGTFKVSAAAGLADTTVALNAAFTDPTNGQLTKQGQLQIKASASVPATPGVALVANSSSAVTVNLTPADALQSGFDVRYSTDPAAATNSSFAWPNPVHVAVLAYQITGLPASTTVYVQARATSDAGNSPYSAVKVVQTLAAQGPAAPTISLTASQGAVNTATTLVLLAAGTNLSRVRLFRNGTQLGSDLTASPWRATLQLTSADNGTLEFKAVGYNANGDSAESEVVDVQVNIAAPVVIPAPTNTRALAVLGGTQLTATNNAGPTAVLLAERSSSVDGTYVQVGASDPGETTLIDTGVQAGSTVYYRFRSQTAQGFSGYSDPPLQYVAPQPSQLQLGEIDANVGQIALPTGQALSLVATARASNGSLMAGIPITPLLVPDGVASILPATAVTNAQGRAIFSVTLGALTGVFGTLTLQGTDGQASAEVDIPVFSIPVLSPDVIAALLAKQIDPKYTDEVFIYVFDFSPYLADDETLTATRYVEVLVSGREDSGNPADDATDMMVLGPPQLAPKYAVQFMHAGSRGMTYTCRCSAVTSYGQTVDTELTVRVSPAKGQRASRVGNI